MISLADLILAHDSCHKYAGKEMIGLEKPENDGLVKGSLGDSHTTGHGIAADSGVRYPVNVT